MAHKRKKLEKPSRRLFLTPERERAAFAFMRRLVWAPLTPMLSCLVQAPVPWANRCLGRKEAHVVSSRKAPIYIRTPSATLASAWAQDEQQRTAQSSSVRPR